MTPSLILASGSTSRQRMLAAAGVAVSLAAHTVDEPVLMRELATAGATPAQVAARLAAEKALSVSRDAGDALVIGADQTLDLAGETFGKPRDRADAARHLARLAGRTHQLHSAFAVARGGRIVARQMRSARLTVRPLSADAIAAYLEAAGPGVFTSVGAYQVEGLGITLFDRIDGDYFTILGLPLLPLLRALRRLGAIA